MLSLKKDHVDFDHYQNFMAWLNGKNEVAKMAFMKG
jgi:hypothetical protein